MFTVTRSKYNPLIAPYQNHSWETVATFNATPAIHQDQLHLLYRAMSDVDPVVGSNFRMSVIAQAISDDCHHFTQRSVFIYPEYDYEKYGVEDPRITRIEDTYFIFYTALGGFPFTADNIKIAVAMSKDLKTIDEKHLVTPFNAKAMVLFPEKINGDYVAILSVNTDRKPSFICIARFKSLEQMWSEEYWNDWYADLDKHKLYISRYHTDQVEVGAAPLKTPQGWLLIYSHIQNYGSERPVFGIEALLLNLENPQQILHRTKGPMMVPEEYYECIGIVPNIVFPSGALLKGNVIELFYGGADTVVGVAYIPLDCLLVAMIARKGLALRYEHNPILEPRVGVKWEEGGVLNPAAIEIDGNIYLLYRAVAKGNISTIGLAVSRDGMIIDERLNMPVYHPRAAFELPVVGSTENYGTEDPRIVQIDDRLYMTYTAYNGKNTRLAISSIAVSDFLARRFDAWSMPRLISPEGVDDKNGAIFPEPIHGKYVVLHRISGHICIDYVSTLAFEKPMTRYIEIMGPRWGMWDSRRIGIAAPPIRTGEGWLLFYHGLSEYGVYRVGAVLLDILNPGRILARSAHALFEPETDYEINGVVDQVVFPCGMVVRNGVIYMYYGAGDRVVGEVTFHTEEVLKSLRIADGSDTPLTKKLSIK